MTKGVTLHLKSFSTCQIPLILPYVSYHFLNSLQLVNNFQLPMTAEIN